MDRLALVPLRLEAALLQVLGEVRLDLVLVYFMLRVHNCQNQFLNLEHHEFAQVNAERVIIELHAYKRLHERPAVHVDSLSAALEDLGQARDGELEQILRHRRTLDDSLSDDCDVCWK